MQHNSPRGNFETSPTEESGSDEQAIQLGIEMARAEDREVDDAVARALAAQLHGGQNTALYSLASTGNLDDPRLEAELRELYQSPDERILDWASVLGAYALHREQRGPVDGWVNLWPGGSDQPPAVHADAGTEAQAEPRPRISAAGTTALGQVATHSAADGGYGRGAIDLELDEADDLPWTDAARWRPDTDDEADVADDVGPNAVAVEALFGGPIVESIGSREDMGWCGLVRHEGRPGGAILLENSYGRRTAWVTDSDEELAARWQDLQEEHEAYQLAREATAAYHGESPEIWVGSLADYAAGYLHGVWLNAALTPGELAPAIQFVLRNSHEPDAEEYGIFDFDGFGGEVTSLLGEYPSLETVTKIAQGIAEHGPAYAAWAAYVGPESYEQLDRFEDHYLGEWESIEVYAEDLLRETEAYRVIEEAPRGLQPYLHLDVEAYARDLRYELHVVEKLGGGVWLFDTGA